MGEIFKKALGVFVDFKEDDERREAPEPEAAEQAATAVAVDAPADLSQYPDVVRVRQAIQMLADLPLADIPVEKARKLIAGALQLGGLNAADMAGSFQRAAGLFQEMMEAEMQAIATRHRVNVERVQLLEKALAEEKSQCAAEVEERNRRIEQAKTELSQIDQALSFFVTEAK